MMTLQQIRDQSPCSEGWTKLLKSLGNPPMDTAISLGDVAKSNGADDAWWCVRALDWSDEALRRQIIAALLPTVQRAATNTKDVRVHNCISAIQDWIDEKPIDLMAAADAAWAATVTTWAAATVTTWAAATWAATGRAWAVLAAWAATEASETDAQRADLIAVFPPLVLAGGKDE